MGFVFIEENVEVVFGEIRFYLVGIGGGEFELVKIDGLVVKVRFGGLVVLVMIVWVVVI